MFTVYLIRSEVAINSCFSKKRCSENLKQLVASCLKLRQNLWIMLVNDSFLVKLQVSSLHRTIKHETLHRYISRKPFCRLALSGCFSTVLLEMLELKDAKTFRYNVSRFQGVEVWKKSKTCKPISFTYLNVKYDF